MQQFLFTINITFVSLQVSDFTETFPVADLEIPQAVPLCDSKNPMITVNHSPSKVNPTPPSKASSSPTSCKVTVGQTKLKKATKKTRGHVKSGGRK